MMNRSLLALTFARYTLGCAPADKVMTGAIDQGLGSAPEALNPLTTTAGLTWLDKDFSALTLHDPAFKKISGELASSWSVADGGKPVTSGDVKFKLDLANNPDSGSSFAAKFGNVTRIQTPNAARLDARTSQTRIVEHFRAAHEAVGLPTMAHDIPVYVQVKLERSTLRQMRCEELSVGLRGSSGNGTNFGLLARKCVDDPAFRLFAVALQNKSRTSAEASGVGSFKATTRLLNLITHRHMQRPNFPLNGAEMEQVEAMLEVDGLVAHA